MAKPTQRGVTHETHSILIPNHNKTIGARTQPLTTSSHMEKDGTQGQLPDSVPPVPGTPAIYTLEHSHSPPLSVDWPPPPVVLTPPHTWRTTVTQGQSPGSVSPVPGPQAPGSSVAAGCPDHMPAPGHRATPQPVTHK